MDDVTISGDSVPDRIVWAIRKQVHSRGLCYHKERRYTGDIGEVTGTLINRGRLHVPNRQRKKAYDTRVAIVAATDPGEVGRLTSVLRGLNEQRRQVERG